MRNLKKFLALVLAMMMTLSLMVTVNAANVEFSDSESVTEAFQEDITVLNGMGVIQGYEDGSFGPQRSVTRGQMAAFIYRIATGDATDKYVHNYVGYNTFTDVSNDDWFAGYIGYCANAGYIVGYGDGTFKPFNNVTGYQALAMILRAMGYNEPGHNFTGTGWETYVSSTATQRGMLVNVNKTNYKNSLRQVAPRELVAELTFQGVRKAMVQYTPAFGYQTTGMSGGLLDSNENPSLGRLYYGLTKYDGHIIANQATGERATITDGWMYPVDTTGIVKDQYGSIIYQKIADKSIVTKYKANGTVNPDWATAAADDGTTYVPLTAPAGTEYVLNNNYAYGLGNTMFNCDTGLDMFGHAATVWYDYRDYGSKGYDTYAVIDKATLAKTVFADNALLNANGAGGTINLLDAAQNAGFKGADKAWTEAFMSDRYSQFSAARDNDDAIKSKVGMYTLISNNDDLDVDVVIVLNQEVARIDQRNTTVKNGEYIFLGTGNSSFGAQLASTGTAGQIFDSQLSPASVKELGTVVTAHQIVGTSITKPVVGTADINRTYIKDTGATAPATRCWYQTDKLEPAFTGTISTYKQGSALTGNWLNQNTSDNIVTEVTLTNGTTYKLSGITGSELDYGFDTTDSHLINGVTPLTSFNTAAGVTFSFYEDAVGRFIGVSIPNDSQFLYTTFADYEIGSLGTGTIGYYTYGVDWDGNIVKTNNQVKSIRMPVDNGATPTKFDEARTGSFQWPSTGHVLAEGYNFLPITLKDQGTVSSLGNQIKQGVNTRFMLSPDGDLDWYPANTNGHLYNKYGTRFTTLFNGANAVNTWTITSGDAANGFMRVYNDKDQDATTAAAAGDNLDYLLTNDTKFIVVTGSGTADLSVKIYTGLAGLLDGGTSAVITSGIGLNAGIVDTTKYGDNVYFLTNVDQFGNTNTEKNRTITTVIMSDTNLTQYNAQSLYFSAPGNTATGVKLASDPGTYGTVNQYELYNNGMKDFYWVADTMSTGGNANGTADTGDFYRLTPVGEVNGQTVYMATNATQASVTDTRMSNDVDVRYDYFVVNNLSTADIGGTVFKVDGATVCEAYGQNATGGSGTHASTFVESNTIDSVEKLHHAVSMGKAGTSGDLYYVYVAIVNDGVNVSTIYVTDVNTAMHY